MLSEIGMTEFGIQSRSEFQSRPLTEIGMTEFQIQSKSEFQSQP